MKSLSISFVSLGFAQMLAFANPAPLPDSTYLGKAESITVTNYLGGGTEGGGGQFEGQIKGFDTAFWCVDDQLYFQFGDVGKANVIGLGQITANDPYVRYGNVHNLAASPGDPTWTNVPSSTPSLIAALDSAQQRFEMAAYLVSHYEGFYTSVDGTVQNNAIQQAIWALTNNNTPNAQNGGAFKTITGLGSSDVSTNGYWIDQALANYTSLDLSRWAIVTWSVQDDGTLGVNNYNDLSSPGAPGHQTFLVYLAPGVITTSLTQTPEPGFYGVLALGLSGFAYAIGRRTRSKNVMR